MAQANVMTIIGARPQFVKAAVVSRVLRRSTDLREHYVHTGQHYDEAMSDVFFRELEIPAPDYNLGVGSGSHGEQTGRMLAAIEAVLVKEKPQLVLIYGDTNSTLAGALAAAKLHIPVAHVEAGLRSFNRRMPEEINRVVTDHLSDLLLAPTDVAVHNLRNEGVATCTIHQVGDVMFDAAMFYAGRACAESSVLDRLNLVGAPYALATIHRAENTDDLTRLAIIWDALCTAADDMRIVLPLHPRTRKKLGEAGLLDRAPAGLTCLEPVGYLDMALLEQRARLIVTDSGGVQKEAFFHGVPCVTLRDETEWVELVATGWNRLAPPVSSGAIRAAMAAMLRSPQDPATRPPLYGDGRAAEKIVQVVGEFMADLPIRPVKPT